MILFVLDDDGFSNKIEIRVNYSDFYNCFLLVFYITVIIYFVRRFLDDGM